MKFMRKLTTQFLIKIVECDAWIVVKDLRHHALHFIIYFDIVSASSWSQAPLDRHH